MRSTKRIISLILVSILLIALAIPSFADPGKGNDDKEKGNKFTTEDKKQGPPDFVIKKHELKGFTSTEGNKIKFNHGNSNFEVGPVIKDGRTLIPVRAITEAMGAKVEYSSDTGIVKITSEDGNTVILFYLNEDDNGKITVNGEDVTIDVRPGIINNRTFVPLRFIAETLGLKVVHDPGTGNTDVINTLKLSPTHYDFSNREVLTDVKLSYSMDAEYNLVSIKNGAVLLGSAEYTTSSNTITILESYIDDFTTDKTTLTLTFKDTKDVTVEKTFEITINQDGVYEKPVLNKSGVKFFSGDIITAVEITVDWNEHTLKEIKNGDTVVAPVTAYTVSGNKITLKQSYVEGLPSGITPLTLVFKASDNDLVNLTFTIEK